MLYRVVTSRCCDLRVRLEKRPYVGDGGGVPKVEVAADGRIVTDPDVGPVAMVWLPRSGQLVAKIPPRKGNYRWLHETVRVRSPRLDRDRWYLPRSCLVKLVNAAVDRYGYIVVWRDMSRLSRCTRACLEATGLDCDCSCLGVHHGVDDDSGWFEIVEDIMVADHGEIKRTAVVYGPRGEDEDGDGGGAAVYSGELSGQRYRADRAGRRGWPLAARYMCAGCMSARACVWDHCHTHGFVRAPLCHTCNTRQWRGWRPAHGRARPAGNLDTSYYRWCPRYDEQRLSCSA